MQEPETIMSERLQADRREAKLTQAEFAKVIGVSPCALTNYELALREIPLSIVLSVNEKFDVDLVWLTIGIGTSHRETPSDVAVRVAKAIKSFELTKNIQLSPEKTETVTKYVFKENIQNRAYSEVEIHEYLETVI